MNAPSRLNVVCLGAAAFLFALLAAPALPSSGAATANSAVESIPSAWQHHKVQFDYFGVTTLYSCDGLEVQVSRILQFFGARKDLKVQARGCLRGPVAPNRQILVLTDFYTLAPLTAAAGADAIQAQWNPLDVIARRPSFLSEGDCELLEDMRPLISQHFGPRGLDYRTNCTPRETNIASYEVKGEFLRVIAAKTG
jgi:hypothetical protein